MLLISVLICSVLGFGTAFYFERKLSKFIDSTFQKIFFWIATASLGYGLTSALNFISALQLLDIPINYSKLTNDIVVNIFLIPALSYLAIKVLKFSNRKTSNSTIKKNSLNLSQDEVNDFYELALLEIENGTYAKGLWAKSLVESDGNESVAKANYIARRVAHMKRNRPPEPQVIAQSSSTQESEIALEKTLVSSDKTLVWVGSQDYEIFEKKVNGIKLLLSELYEINEKKQISCDRYHISIQSNLCDT
jgi:hypothetical protein